MNRPEALSPADESFVRPRMAPQSAIPFCVPIDPDGGHVGFYPPRLDDLLSMSGLSAVSFAFPGSHAFFPTQVVDLKMTNAEAQNGYQATLGSLLLVSSGFGVYHSFVLGFFACPW